MATWTGPNILSSGEQKISKLGNFFQKDFPEMLSLKMIRGTRNGLNDASSVMLSQSTAKALFGADDPMNKSIRISDRMDAKVTGVYEDLPYNTTFHDIEFMASWELLVNSDPWFNHALNQWGNNSFQLFAQLMPNANIETVSEKIKNVKAEHGKDERQFNPEIFLQPMKDWHLYSDWKDGKNIGGRIQMAWMFGIIGLFVLLLACINFMNLSTARSEKRAKEVGIRMAIGSIRSQLINQFLSESFLVVLLAFVLAVVFVLFTLPMFNSLADKRISIDWSNPYLWLISGVFIIITSLLAGSYPAFYLSSFQPVKVLKGTFKVGRLASLPRKVLVVVQFTVSLTLIIGTIIVYEQIQFSKSRPTGYDRAGIIMTQMKSAEFTNKLDVLRTELKNCGGVEEVSESSGPITGIWSNNGGFEWEGKDPNLQPEFATVDISHEYGKTINWNVIEGRDLSREFSTDSSGLILNEAAVKFMSLKNPVGKEITWDGRKYHVVGVIKDMVMQSPYQPVKQTVYAVNYKKFNWINIKLNPNKSASECIALIEGVFKKNISTAPFEYSFVDDDYARKFDTEERIGKLSYIFAILAILISCLGLLGLASFVAEQRTKEIGIRKVLGASVLNLWRMLSGEFIVLVVLSSLVAMPLAYYFLNGWLQRYEYRTEIGYWIFIVTLGGALLITVITVSFQSLKAAFANPVKSLRSE
jgi:ABC-type antimicrobial peptide transport system permease subunit